MLLGKRPRPPMKRTTSMTEFTAGVGDNFQPPSDHPNTLRSTVAQKNHRRNSADFMETAHFLRACHLCKRRLIAGHDIFIYRGDRAFCSSECRQEQMNQDENKDKRSSSSNKHKTPVVTASTNASETVAAM